MRWCSPLTQLLSQGNTTKEGASSQFGVFSGLMAPVGRTDKKMHQLLRYLMQENLAAVTHALIITQLFLFINLLLFK